MHDPVEIAVPENESDVRVDVCLVRRVEGLSRSRAKQCGDAKLVRVNGRVAAKGHVLVAGDRVSLLEVPRSVAFEARPAPDIPLDVIYEHADVVVVNKPPGLPS